MKRGGVIGVLSGIGINLILLGCTSSVPVRLVADVDMGKSECFRKILQRLSTQKLLSVQVSDDLSLRAHDLPFWMGLDSVSYALASSGAVRETAGICRPLLHIHALCEYSGQTKGGTWVCRDQNLLRVMKTCLLQGSVYLVDDFCSALDQLDISLVFRFENEDVFLNIGEMFAEIDAKGLNQGQGYFLNGSLAIILLYAFEQPEFFKVEPDWLFPETSIGLRSYAERVLLGHLTAFLAALADRSREELVKFLGKIDPAVKNILDSAWAKAESETCQAVVMCEGCSVYELLLLLATDKAGKKVESLQVSYSNPLIFADTWLIRLWWCFLEEAIQKIGQQPAECNSWRLELHLKDTTRERSVFQTLTCAHVVPDKGRSIAIRSPVSSLLLLTIIETATVRGQLRHYECNAVREILKFTVQWNVLLTLIRSPDLLERFKR